MFGVFVELPVFSEHKLSIRCAIEETLNCRVSPNQVPDANQENQHSIIDNCIKDRTCFLEKALELSKSLNGSGSTESAPKSDSFEGLCAALVFRRKRGRNCKPEELPMKMCNNVQNNPFATKMRTFFSSSSRSYSLEPSSSVSTSFRVAVKVSISLHSAISVRCLFSVCRV